MTPQHRESSNALSQDRGRVREVICFYRASKLGHSRFLRKQEIMTGVSPGVKAVGCKRLVSYFCFVIVTVTAKPSLLNFCSGIHLQSKLSLNSPAPIALVDHLRSKSTPNPFFVILLSNGAPEHPAPSGPQRDLNIPKLLEK